MLKHECQMMTIQCQMINPCLVFPLSIEKFTQENVGNLMDLQLQQDLLEPHLSDLKNQLVCFCFANFERAASSSLIMTRE